MLYNNSFCIRPFSSCSDDIFLKPTKWSIFAAPVFPDFFQANLFVLRHRNSGIDIEIFGQNQTTFILWIR